MLLVRESPLHTGHLRMLANLSECGAIIAPPVPAFYAGPKTIEEVVMIDHDNGEVDDETRLENEEKEVLLKHHLACKRIEALY